MGIKKSKILDINPFLKFTRVQNFTPEKIKKCFIL